MSKIMIVEDDAGILHSLSRYLQGSGFEVVLCDNGQNAESLFSATHPDLILLDINLPGINGKELVEIFQKRNAKIPILMLTARVSEEDIVECFEKGARDYIKKPFSSRELVARIRIHLGDTQNQEERIQPLERIEFDGLILDSQAFTVYLDTQEVECTKTEFQLLWELFQEPKKLISREFLMKKVMGYEHYIYDRTIDTHMKNIRKKIEG
jgi:DNA-binding response OmpR family regulator